MKFLKYVFLLLLLTLNTSVNCQEVDYGTLAPADFMRMARYRMALQDSFADLRGRITHLRRNRGGAVFYPVRFVVRFGAQVDARINVDNREVHTLVKNHRTGLKKVTSSVPLEKSILHDVGFKLEDLTLDFLDYPVAKECASETVKTVACRVMLLEGKNGEKIKVWLSKEYLFPLKAEFFGAKTDLAGKPDRSLEITGFEKVNDYYVATEIALFSANFRTRIAFGDCKVCKADSPQAAAEFGK